MQRNTTIISNTVTNNTIESNNIGIYILRSNNNIIHHNNFVNNTRQVYSRDSINSWDDGYPSGGNYWSDYTGMDVNGDGIGDTAYVLDETNQDIYPFMNAINKARSQPQVELNPIFVAFRTATIIIVAILAYFLKNMRSKKHLTPKKS